MEKQALDRETVRYYSNSLNNYTNVIQSCYDEQIMVPLHVMRLIDFFKYQETRKRQLV